MKFRVNKRRRAISEIMGALIMVAMTLIAGSAAFGWINGQARTSETQYGNSVAGGVNFLREHYSIVSTQFSNAGGAACSGSPRTCTTATFYVFNNGQLTMNISSIIIQPAGLAWTLTFKTAAYTQSGCSIPAISPNQKLSGNLLPVNTLSSGSYSPFSVAIPGCYNTGMVVGQSYILTLVGVYGSTVQTQQTVSG